MSYICGRQGAPLGRPEICAATKTEYRGVRAAVTDGPARSAARLPTAFSFRLTIVAGLMTFDRPPEDVGKSSNRRHPP